MEKTIMLGGKWQQEKRKTNKRWTDSINAAIGMSLWELGRAGGDRTLCVSLIHRVTRS